MKTVMNHTKTKKIIALTFALAGAPFVVQKAQAAESATVSQINPAMESQLKTALLKIRAHIERLNEATHNLLGHSEIACEVTQTEIMSIYKQLMLLEKKIPAKDPLFVGVKNMAKHFAVATKALLDALQANTVVKLVDAIEKIATASIAALSQELHGEQGLFAQFAALNDTVLTEILDQITEEVDKLTHLDIKVLGHKSEFAMVDFLKAKGFSGEGIIALLGKALPNPQKLRR